MTRGERRRAEREAAKSDLGVVGPGIGGQVITEAPNFIELTNPCRPNFPAFIAGNATVCKQVAVQNSAKGEHIVICGAGPSLADHAAEYCPDADQVWGCNSATTWLADNGHRVTHGFTVDQTPHMVEEWYTAPDVHYLLASTCHPHLVEYLMDKGREITFFHNFVGIDERPVELDLDPDDDPTEWYEGDEVVVVTSTDTGAEKTVRRMAYEDWMYSTLYDPTCRVGSGLNATTRAIDLACYVGAGRITALGADCALRQKRSCPATPYGSPEHLKWLNEDTIMHVDGGNALASEATPMTLTGTIDGREWTTKPDMIITAVWLVQMARALDELEIIGDTLPNALMDKDQDFLDSLPHLPGPDGNPLHFDIAVQGGFVHTDEAA